MGRTGKGHIVGRASVSSKQTIEEPQISALLPTVVRKLKSAALAKRGLERLTRGLSKTLQEDSLRITAAEVLLWRRH